MGHNSKQQQLTPPPPVRSTASTSPSRLGRKKKKKGRPSLLDLQKRSLRLQKQHEEQINRHQQNRRHQQNPNPNSSRRSNRRNPNTDDNDEEEEEEEGSRKEKKLRLVSRLESDSAGFDKAERASSGWKATSGIQERADSGPTTPLPDKMLLVFILDRLQKKDTYGVFSEPVDPEELPDYFDIVKDPMDFSTIRKKLLDEGAYVNLEQFESDVFLITSNAMSYNPPDAIYYRQARAIQELAKKDFENLRQESDSSDPEEKPRRGRPPIKSIFKQKIGRPPAERATADFSGSTPANAGSNGRLSYSGLDDLSRKGSDKSSIPAVQRSSYGLRTVENKWHADHKPVRTEDFSGSSTKGSTKFGMKSFSVDETRRNTYNPSQTSNSSYELPALTSFSGERKILVPVGLHMQLAYCRSLARFASQLGPVGWEIVAKRIERVLPPGTKFGRGWVGDDKAPDPLQPPILTSSSPRSSMQQQMSITSQQSAAASTGGVPSNSLYTEDNHAGTNPSVQALPSVAPSDSNAVHWLDSLTSRGQESGSIQQTSQGAAVHGVHWKTPYHLPKHPALQQPINGFNTALGAYVAPQIEKFAGHSIPPGNSSMQSLVRHANTAFSNHGQMYHPTNSQHNAERTRGDSSLPSSSGVTLPKTSQDCRGPQHSLGSSASPDLNVGLHSPRSQQTSVVMVDSHNSDLVLQL